MSDASADEGGRLECRQIAEILGDYLEGTLPRQTRELLEWHVDGCGPCIAFLNTYRGTVNAAAKLRAVPIPPELKTRLLSVLRARTAEEPPRP